MRPWLVLALVLLAGVAHAEDAFRAYRGQIVVSPDAPPTSSPELLKHLEANATKDHRYDLIKGPPWDVNLVGVLSLRGPANQSGKTIDAPTVTLELSDGDRPVQQVEVTPRHQIVIAHVSATIAAGFEVGKTYRLRMLAGKTVLASAELTLRP